MAEETAFENGQISDFQALVTLTLTLDRVIPSCITRRPVAKYQISWKSKKHLWTDGRTYGQTFETHFNSRLGGAPSRPKNGNWTSIRE